MKKVELKKNKLDLEYHRKVQELNAVIILGTTGLLAFLGTFIWNMQYVLHGLTIASLIGIFCFAWYRKLDQELTNIVRRIERLKV